MMKFDRVLIFIMFIDWRSGLRLESLDAGQRKELFHGWTLKIAKNSIQMVQLYAGRARFLQSVLMFFEKNIAPAIYWQKQLPRLTLLLFTA